MEELNVVEMNQNAVEITPPQTPVINMSEHAQKTMESHGVIVGEIGTKISRVPIEKYKASTQKIDRIGFVSKQLIGVKSHFLEDAGSILCFGKKCCEVAGLPQVRYLFPIVIYSTDNEGTIVGKKIELKILTAGEDLYKSIITINRGLAPQGGIENADMLVTCTDDKYQKITLSPIGLAAWKKSASIVQMVQERWASDAEFAYMALARKVDEATFLKLMGMDSVGGMSSGDNSSTPGGVFNPAVNQDLSKFFED
jgi:hypothetical protein